MVDLYDVAEKVYLADAEYFQCHSLQPNDIELIYKSFHEQLFKGGDGKWYGEEIDEG